MCYSHMSLTRGARIGSYDIVEQIVLAAWVRSIAPATPPRRDVALKLLPPAWRDPNVALQREQCSRR